jgi:hypothetical protein
MTDQPIERWIVIAEGRPPMRPFMIIEQEQESWARELHSNMGPGKWVNARIWHYFDGEITDVTQTADSQNPQGSSDSDVS